jgi:diguanylate cyclase (GGDEF)-like protein/PAS domain S-box-containing protein
MEHSSSTNRWLRRLPALGLFLGLVIVVAIGVASWRQVRAQARAARWVEHTHAVIREFEAIIQGVAEAESALRGFLLSRDPEYLKGVAPAVARINAADRTARRLTAGNPAQQERLRELEILIDRRVHMLERHHAQLDVNAIAAIPEGAPELTEQIRGQVRELVTMERKLLAQRIAQAEASATATIATIAVGTFSSSALIVIAFLAIRREIRRRAASQEALRHKQALLESILEGTNDAMFVKDTEGRYLLINSAGARFLNSTPAEVLGKNDKDFFGETSAEAVMVRDHQVMRSGTIQTYDEEAVIDGVRRIFSATKAAYRDAERQIAGLVGVSRDVTKLRDQEAARYREMGLLLQLGDLLQACRSQEEAGEIISKLAPRFFTEESGAIYAFRSSRNAVELQTSFGEDTWCKQHTAFEPDQCWALRRGQAHYSEEADGQLYCKHVGQPTPASVVCMPLTAHGEVLGVLSLGSPRAWTEDLKRQVTLVSEQCSLALANLRLRETLRDQSIRDALTGLFNRRYTEETLERELRRAARESKPITLLMIDVDHFKRFNDTFGHAAGDHVLRELGQLMRGLTRASDIASRMGGEELVVVMPGASLDEGVAKAEQLREAVSRLDLRHGGQALGPLSISVGVAEYPTQADRAEVLLEIADQALYQAKAAGRNRVVAAPSPSAPESKPIPSVSRSGT